MFTGLQPHPRSPATGRPSPAISISGVSHGYRGRDGARVQALVLVRDDVWMNATRFLRALEVPLVEGVSSAAVDLFDLPHARKVLTEFGRAYGRFPEGIGRLTPEQERFIDRALAELSQDG